MKVIVLVGYPGSGKTTYANSIPQFFRLDGDFLKTSNKVQIELRTALKNGLDVIVDSTNMSVKRRKDIIDICKEMSVEVECVWLKTTLEYAYQQNMNRAKVVPKIAYYTLRKHFVEPTCEEGFSSINVICN